MAGLIADPFDRTRLDWKRRLRGGSLCRSHSLAAGDSACGRSGQTGAEVKDDAGRTVSIVGRDLSERRWRENDQAQRLFRRQRPHMAKRGRPSGFRQRPAIRISPLAADAFARSSKRQRSGVAQLHGHSRQRSARPRAALAVVLVLPAIPRLDRRRPNVPVRRAHRSGRRRVFAATSDRRGLHHQELLLPGRRRLPADPHAGRNVARPDTDAAVEARGRRLLQPRRRLVLARQQSAHRPLDRRQSHRLGDVQAHRGGRNTDVTRAV